MQSSIKNQTGDYTVLDNAQALKEGTLKPSDLPEIRIWKDNYLSIYVFLVNHLVLVCLPLVLVHYPILYNLQFDFLLNFAYT